MVVDTLVALLMLQMGRNHGSIMPEWFVRGRGSHVVVVVIVRVTLPTEIGGPLVLVRRTVL